MPPGSRAPRAASTSIPGSRSRARSSRMRTAITRGPAPRRYLCARAVARAPAHAGSVRTSTLDGAAVRRARSASASVTRLAPSRRARARLRAGARRARRRGVGRLRRLQARAGSDLRAVRGRALRHVRHRGDVRAADLPLAGPHAVVARDLDWWSENRARGRAPPCSSATRSARRSASSPSSPPSTDRPVLVHGAIEALVERVPRRRASGCCRRRLAEDDRAQGRRRASWCSRRPSARGTPGCAARRRLGRRSPRAGCASAARVAGAGSTAASCSPTTPTGRPCSRTIEETGAERVLVDPRLRRGARAHLRERGLRRAARSRTACEGETDVVRRFAALYDALDARRRRTRRSRRWSTTSAPRRPRTRPGRCTSSPGGGSSASSARAALRLDARGDAASRMAARGMLRRGRRPRGDHRAARRPRATPRARTFPCRMAGVALAAAPRSGRRGDAREHSSLGGASLPPRELFLLNKMHHRRASASASPQTLVVRALARSRASTPAVMAHRLMGTGSQPPRFLRAAVAAEGTADDASRPYPFFLASPLERAAETLGAPDDWLAEWKWDGIRAQVVRRGDDVFLWSRGEELVTERFPEIEPTARRLPDGTVLDGEVLAWRDGRPLPFAVLQRRIGRQKLTPRVLGRGARRVHGLRPARGRAASTSARARSPSARARSSDCSRDVSSARLLSRRRWSRDSWAELATLRGRGARARRRRADAEAPRLALPPGPAGATGGSGRSTRSPSTPCWSTRIPATAGARASSPTTRSPSGRAASWCRSPRRTRACPTRRSPSSTLDPRAHAREFGPVRAVEPVQVFELAFEGIPRSSRHKAGIAVRFPRIARWRKDKPARRRTRSTACARSWLRPLRRRISPSCRSPLPPRGPGSRRSRRPAARRGCRPSLARPAGTSARDPRRRACRRSRARGSARRRSAAAGTAGCATCRAPIPRCRDCGARGAACRCSSACGLVSSCSARTIASRYAGAAVASGVAMKRVPTTAPCAPSASAATTPRPSTMPPAATTGIFTASTTCGTSASVPDLAGVAARLGALRGDDVGAGLLGAHRVLHLADMTTIFMPCALHLGDVLLAAPRGRRRRSSRPPRRATGRYGHDHLRDRREQVDRERLRP